MFDVHGFVDPFSIPVPNRPAMALGAILSEHESSNRAFREIQASSMRSRGDMQAAADVITNGSLQVPCFEQEILDYVKRRGYLGQRIRSVLAVGQPGHYFEQNAIVNGTFVDPRQLAVTAQLAKRSERYVTLKAIAAQTNFGLFDVELGRLRGSAASSSGLLAKDIEDMITGILKSSDLALWNGTDTDMAVPTTLQYVGLLTQINRTASCASNASAIDAIKREVASIRGNQNFEAKPTAFYVQEELHAVLEEEERLNQRQMPTAPDNNVTAGLGLTGIRTSAGTLPVIGDWSLGSPVPSVSEPGKKDYTGVLLTEDLIEYQYLGSAEPRLFLLGLTNNLASQYVAVMFGAPVAKGKAATTIPEVGATTYAHSIITITK